MRGLFWVLGLFAAAVGLSLVARYNEGYVLLFVAPKRIELSLTLFAILQVAAFVVLYFFVRAAAYTLKLPDMVREFRASRARARARHALFEALVCAYEGRFVRAERAARQAYQSGDEPGLAALVAARAAHSLNLPQLRDRWLECARDAATTGDGKSLVQARLMTEAELLSAERRDGDALAVLREMRKNGARHIAAQRLTLTSLSRLEMWEEALKVARQLEEHRAIHPAVMEKTREAAYASLFGTTDAALLRERLRRLPRADRKRAAVVRMVARGLLGGALVAEARELIESVLEDGWDDALGALYADCAVADPAAIHSQLERGEAWRVRFPREPGLLLSLGRICGTAGLWGKAQEYLELSLSLKPERAGHLALARIFDATGRGEDANRHYRAAALA